VEEEVAARGGEREGSKEGVGYAEMEAPPVPIGLALPLPLPDTFNGVAELVGEVVGVAAEVPVAPPPPLPPPPPPALPPKSEGVGVVEVEEESVFPWSCGGEGVVEKVKGEEGLKEGLELLLLVAVLLPPSTPPPPP